MPTQSIALRDHSKNPEDVTSNLTTLSATGSGNGFEVPWTGILLVYLVNDTGSSSAVTIKGAATQDETDRGLSIPNETVTIADGEHFTWYPSSRFKTSGGTIIIEADQLIKIKAIKTLTIA